MKAFKTIFTFIVIAFGLSCFQAKGQVTIGSDIAPLQGVLLDIKSKAGTAGSGDATTDASGGGLGLPRVTLTSLTSLAPFLASATTAQMKDRTGLMVYNISAANNFKPGIYVWNGAKWTTTGEGVKYFYMPSVNISATTGTGKQFNLYQAYKDQFDKTTNGSTGPQTWVSSNNTLAFVPSPESDRLYAYSELDYVITYYDKSVFSNISINTSGMMTYTVAAASPNITSATYFNIVFVVK
ncbi:MAG: hypothetical protein LBJ39_00215 [Tannerellaceae bacterium]|jgi:hypothetical protein|nr:hypothetical protein [Tannerellaceae bacterium]